MNRGCLYFLPPLFCYLCISGVQPFESYHPARSVSSIHLALPCCRRSIVEDIRQVLLFSWAIVLRFVVITQHCCYFLPWFSISSIPCVSEHLYCSYCIYIVCELGRCRLYCHLEVNKVTINILMILKTVRPASPKLLVSSETLQLYSI